MGDVRAFGPYTDAAGTSPSALSDVRQFRNVFVVSESKMAREAFCTAFRQAEHALSFFPTLTVEDISVPDAEPSAILAALYAGSGSSSPQWVRRELALAGRLSIRVALLCDATIGIEKVAEYIGLGCRGFISTGFSFAVAISVMKIVAAGEVFVPAEIVQDAAQQETLNVRMPSIPRDPIENAATGWDALSWRERTVLELVCRGMPNKAIGNELGIATNTVKIHVSSIMKKLKVTNRTQLCALCSASRRS
jgi:DNA-binding NarL/FixJ family response regulator